MSGKERERKSKITTKGKEQVALLGPKLGQSDRPFHQESIYMLRQVTLIFIKIFLAKARIDQNPGGPPRARKTNRIKGNIEKLILPFMTPLALGHTVILIRRSSDMLQVRVW